MATINTEDEFNLIIRRVTDIDGTEDAAQQIYSKWATQYEQDMTTHLEYNCPKYVAKELECRMGDQKAIRILDIGAGTGLVAIELAKLGYTNVDALDTNPDMLVLAKQKGLYNKCIQGYLGPEPLDIPDGSYDGLVCSGTFLPNHADERCLEDLVRITKPGGFIVITVNCKHVELVKNMDLKIDALQAAGHAVHLNPGDIRDIIVNTDNTTVKGIVYVLQTK